MTEYTYDPDRAREAALWFLQKGPMNLAKLCKLLMLADYEHVKRYERSIVGGHLVLRRGLRGIHSDLYTVVVRFDIFMSLQLLW
jgi:hypothetical protein